ncbi:MAG: hypothetical protein M1837_002086 [Sclerophora amabilis]|nr:MAG: hypothetical protein M1837_002086 [Sclerophora amabilis]
MNAHTFVDAASSRLKLRSEDYELLIRQGPERARVAGVKEKDRKPVDPPPIIQLRIKDDTDPAQNYLQSPYYFMCCNLYDANAEQPAAVPQQSALAGTLVSSLHRLKDIDNSDGGFFVFGDLSVKLEGEFRLRFSLFEMLKQGAGESTKADLVEVHAAKNFPGMSESTFLSRSFGDQGVRLRIRKEPRTLLKRPQPPGMRPEDYSRSFPPQMPPDPQTLMTSARPQSMVGYVQSPGREYSYGEPSKRQRTSVDMSNPMMYDRDPQYNQRMYPQQQAPQYAGYTQQPQAQSFYGMPPYQGSHSAPAGMADYSFRHPQSSAGSSPYESPGSQRGQRSPMLPSSGYAPQSQVRYQPQQAPQNPNQGPPPMHMPHPQDASLPHRPSHYQSNVAPGSAQQTPSTLPLPPSSSLQRPTQNQPEYSTQRPPINPMPMPPPPPGPQRQPSQVQLPPLASSAGSNPSSMTAAGPQAHTPSHSPRSSTPSGRGSRYQPGPPRSFDTASHQHPHPPPPS